MTKPCPYCGSTELLPYNHKPDCYFRIRDKESRTETIAPKELILRAWNNRPLEDNLRESLSELYTLISMHGSKHMLAHATILTRAYKLIGDL